MINYIKVKLKTDPNTEFTVPQEYDIRANDLIGSIMGMSSAELREKLPEIVANMNIWEVPASCRLPLI